MKLKEFLTKWEWLDLEDADKDLTACEQKIWELIEKKAQLEDEYKEHQEAMQEADNTIKVLNKALELACNELPSPIVFMGNYMQTVDDWCKYFKTTARKELKNE